jgi:hypothetical protein
MRSPEGTRVWWWFALYTVTADEDAPTVANDYFEMLILSGKGNDKRWVGNF